LDCLLRLGDQWSGSPRLLPERGQTKPGMD